MKTFINILIEFILLIIAIFVTVIGYPIAVIWAICRGAITKKYILEIATSIDQTGNTLFSYLFNDILITKNGYKFGNIDETISSAIGKNRIKGTLTKTGKALDSILDFIDKNHSIKSIEENP